MLEATVVNPLRNPLVLNKHAQTECQPCRRATRGLTTGKRRRASYIMLAVERALCPDWGFASGLSTDHQFS